MKDKELIAMLDCQEIQSRWCPEKGDICHDREYGTTCRVTDLYTGGRIEILSLDGEEEDAVHPNSITFIPSIENLIFWIGKDWFSLTRLTDEELEGDVEHRELAWEIK